LGLKKKTEIRENFFVSFLFFKTIFISPPDTPWEGATLKVAIEYSEEYPVKPPSVRFISQVFHPNGKKRYS